jgi:endonuclease/exonuclease/phosphatase family metal-dependent hydrolase
MKIKILSWNIWCDCYFDKVKDFIAASNADIVGLQEVVLNDPERDIVTFMKGLGYEYVTVPSAEFTDDKGKHYVLNNGVFSKYPIVDSKIHLLRKEGKRGVIEAKIKIGSTILSFFSIHLKHTHLQRTELQDEQAQNLSAILPAKSGIVVGDFNSTPESHPINLMGQKYVNADKANTPTWSAYPEGCPVCKPQKIDTCLDYIFVSPDIKFDSFEVGDSKGSDHLPISLSIDL